MSDFELFQSSPSGEAGCYVSVPVPFPTLEPFQSSPSGEAGCY